MMLQKTKRKEEKKEERASSRKRRDGQKGEEEQEEQEQRYPCLLFFSFCSDSRLGLRLLLSKINLFLCFFLFVFGLFYLLISYRVVSEVEDTIHVSSFSLFEGKKVDPQKRHPLERQNNSKEKKERRETAIKLMSRKMKKNKNRSLHDNKDKYKIDNNPNNSNVKIIDFGGKITFEEFSSSCKNQGKPEEEKIEVEQDDEEDEGNQREKKRNENEIHFITKYEINMEGHSRHFIDLNQYLKVNPEKRFPSFDQNFFKRTDLSSFFTSLSSSSTADSYIPYFHPTRIPLLGTNLDFDYRYTLPKLLASIDYPVEHLVIVSGSCDPTVVEELWEFVSNYTKIYSSIDIDTANKNHSETNDIAKQIKESQIDVDTKTKKMIYSPETVFIYQNRVLHRFVEKISIFIAKEELGCAKGWNIIGDYMMKERWKHENSGVANALSPYVVNKVLDENVDVNINATFDTESKVESVIRATKTLTSSQIPFSLIVNADVAMLPDTLYNITTHLQVVRNRQEKVLRNDVLALSNTIVKLREKISDILSLSGNNDNNDIDNPTEKGKNKSKPGEAGHQKEKEEVEEEGLEQQNQHLQLQQQQNFLTNLYQSIEEAKTSLSFLVEKKACINFLRRSIYNSDGFSAFVWFRDCIDRVGKFDENFFPAFLEDNDYSFRISLAQKMGLVFPQVKLGIGHVHNERIYEYNGLEGHQEEGWEYDSGVHKTIENLESEMVTKQNQKQLSKGQEMKDKLARSEKANLYYINSKWGCLEPLRKYLHTLSTEMKAESNKSRRFYDGKGKIKNNDFGSSFPKYSPFLAELPVQEFEQELTGFNVYGCEFQYPFNLSFLKIKDWLVDEERIECIQTGNTTEKIETIQTSDIKPFCRYHFDKLKHKPKFHP